MYARATPDQFKITDGTVIHTPTGAEFTPVSGAPGSLMIWTGQIGAKLPNGQVFSYDDVLAMMRSFWRDRAAQVYA